MRKLLFSVLQSQVLDRSGHYCSYDDKIKVFPPRVTSQWKASHGVATCCPKNDCVRDYGSAELATVVHDVICDDGDDNDNTTKQ